MDSRLIVIVCRGNIGRSPFAEAVINQEIIRRNLTQEIKVISRGVQGTSVDPQQVKFPNITHYKELYEDSKPTLDELGVDLSQHVSKPINRDDVERAEILLAMDGRTRDGLLALFPDQSRKVHLVSKLVGRDYDITDPEGVNGADRQRRIFIELKGILSKGFPQLLELLQVKQKERK